MEICSESRKQLFEVRIIRTKISKGSSNEHSMGMKPKYVVVTWIQIPSFDEMNWKIVLKIPPHGPASDPVGSPAPLLWGTPVKVKPCHIRDIEEPIVVCDQYHNDPNAHLCCKKGKDLRSQGQLASAHCTISPSAHGRGIEYTQSVLN